LVLVSGSGVTRGVTNKGEAMGSYTNHKPIPSESRKRAQDKQIMRMGRCQHPDSALTLTLVIDGGYIEYCTNCNKVTEIY